MTLLAPRILRWLVGSFFLGGGDLCTPHLVQNSCEYTPRLPNSLLNFNAAALLVSNTLSSTLILNLLSVQKHTKLTNIINLYYVIFVGVIYQKKKLISPLKTKRRPLYLKTQSVPRCKHFSSRL